MEDADYEAIESLVIDYFLACGPLPNHEKKGERRNWFVALLDNLKEHGYGSDFVFYASGQKTSWNIIMSESFRTGSGALNKSQKVLREDIVNDLRAAIAVAYKEERLAKAKRVAPVKESIPDIPVQTNAEVEPCEKEQNEEVDSDEHCVTGEAPKEFASAAEANAALQGLKVEGAPKVEPDFDPEMAELMGLKESE